MEFCKVELLVLPSLFIPPVIYFYQCRLIDIYSVDFNTILSFFFFCSIFSCFSHCELPQFGSCAFWTWPHLFVSTSLFSGTARYSIYIFPAPYLESATSPRSPSSFDGRYKNNFNFVISYLKVEIHTNK